MITPYTIRIRSHLLKLESETSRERRMALLRGISEAALDGHDHECRELDALNSVKADPSTNLEIAG